MRKLLLTALLFASQVANADTEVFPCFTTTANLLTCLISGYSIVWPAHQGATGTTLVNDGFGNLTWVATGVGSVSGTTPIVVTGPAATPTVSITQSGAASSGYLSSTDWNTFNNKQNPLLTTKGDLLTYSTTPVRLPVGSNGQALLADSTQTSGVKWGAVNGMAIGNAVTGSTVGSIFFADGSDNLAQDNADFFWDGTNHRLGIGTTSPGDLLDVSGKFQVDASGDPVKINNVAYAWPALQGGASTLLQNNGSGTLSWVAAGSGMAIGSAVTSGTASSVLFVDGSGNLAQDNTRFLWDDTGHVLGTPTSATASNGFTVASGAGTSTGSSGAMFLQSGTVVDGASGNATLRSGAASGNGNSGDADISTGSATVAGNSGNVNVLTGNAFAQAGNIVVEAGSVSNSGGTPGQVTVEAGNTSGASTTAANLVLSAGSASGATSHGGNVNVFSGSGTTSGGKINLNNSGGTGIVMTTTSSGAKVTGGGPLIVDNGHIRSTQTTAPTAVPTGNAGTGATCTLTHATDAAGFITLATGTGTSTGDQCDVTFNAAYSTAPVCTLSSASQNAGTNLLSAFITTSTSGFSLQGGSFGSTTFVFTYTCIETQ